MIIGGHYQSLGAARNLHSEGVPVCVVDSERCVAQFSSRVRRTYRSPAIEAEPEFVDFLCQLASEAALEGWVLFPSTDQGVRVLAFHREQLGRHYRLITPSWEVVRHFYDKRLTHQLAEACAVPTPETWWLDGGTDDLDTALSRLEQHSLRELAGGQFPLVLKPAITTHLTSVTKKKAYRAEGPAELLATFRMMASIMDPTEIMIQELIPGEAAQLYSYGGVFCEGRPVAGFAAARPRQHPMEFGKASTLVETVTCPELEQLATRLLERVGYSGLAEVEFMYDARHERFELLEVNPRIWGWQSIGKRAGVNVPYLAYEQALSPTTLARATARTGVKWMRLITDAPTAAGEIRRGRLTVSQYLRSMRGPLEFAVLSLNDPLPFLMELFLIPYYAKRRGF